MHYLNILINFRVFLTLKFEFNQFISNKTNASLKIKFLKRGIQFLGKKILAAFIITKTLQI